MRLTSQFLRYRRVVLQVKRAMFAQCICVWASLEDRVAILQIGINWSRYICSIPLSSVQAVIGLKMGSRANLSKDATVVVPTRSLGPA